MVTEKLALMDQYIRYFNLSLEVSQCLVELLLPWNQFGHVELATDNCILIEQGHPMPYIRVYTYKPSVNPTTSLLC